MTTRDPNAPILALLDAEVVLGPAREIGADDRTVWDHQIPFEVKEIEGESEGGKPYFAVIDVLYEGHSKKSDGSPNVHYSDVTVRETAKQLPGTMSYRGHQKPENADSEYRDPVGKCIASRVVNKDIPGLGNVPVAEGKFFISSTATDIRTHLREGLAGPVSIHGIAAFKSQNGRRTNQTVGMRRLKSVDFCNPGTPGMRAAGVTAVVREMAENEGGGKPQQGAKKMSERPEITTVAALQSTYPDLCKMLVQTETSAISGSVTEMEQAKDKADERVEALESEVKEQTKRADDAEKAHGEAVKRAETAEATVKEQAATVAVAKVSDALSTRIDERINVAKQGDDKTKAKHEVAVLEMARKRFSVTKDHVVESDDDDHTLSVKKAESAFDAECAGVREMAESMGVTLKPEGDDGDRDVREIGGGRRSSGNERGASAREDKYQRLLPSYKRQKAGWKDGE